MSKVSGSLRRRGARVERERPCAAHNGWEPAVAVINVSGEGDPWQIAVCARHLAAFEATVDAWSMTD